MEVGVVVFNYDHCENILKKCMSKLINSNHHIYKCNYYSKEFYLIILEKNFLDKVLSLDYFINNYKIKELIFINVIFSKYNCNDLYFFQSEESTKLLSLISYSDLKGFKLKEKSNEQLFQNKKITFIEIIFINNKCNCYFEKTYFKLQKFILDYLLI